MRLMSIRAKKVNIIQKGERGIGYKRNDKENYVD